MLLIVKYCCRILWKHCKQVEHVKFIWLALICLLCLQNNVDGTTSTNPSQRIQRRFMWKQMDHHHPMAGIVGGMVTNARGAMKNMFGELMPTIQTTGLPSNLLDYLPSETTRIKYIIRNPPKSMKVVKIRSPKKIIKIMTVPKAIVENKYSVKPKKFKFPSIEELRKLEKEQEMIAEGRLPHKSGMEILTTLTNSKQQHHEEYNKQQPKESNEIVSGKIHEFGGEWRPVYEALNAPAAFSTAKPFAVSQLHTNIISEMLPVPEKHIHYPNQVQEQQEDDTTIQKHYYEPSKNTYEVTEYIAEESVALPLTQDFRSNMRAGAGGGGDFLPTRTPHQYNAATNIPTTTSTSTTSEEPPNYPISFLRKYRERSTVKQPLPSQTATRFKASLPVLDSVWIPSQNHTNLHILRTSKQQQPQPQPHKKSEKWPPDVQVPRPFREITSTEASAQRLQSSQPPQQKIEPIQTQRKSTPSLKTSHPLQSEINTSKSARQRGSVKFGDKINSDQL